MIWTGTETELHRFVDHCNKFQKIIKFSMKFSDECIPFLDTITKRSPRKPLLKPSMRADTPLKILVVLDFDKENVFVKKTNNQPVLAITIPEL